MIPRHRHTTMILPHPHIIRLHRLPLHLPRLRRRHQLRLRRRLQPHFPTLPHQQHTLSRWTHQSR